MASSKGCLRDGADSTTAGSQYLEYLLDMHSTMAQEDEKSLRDDEADGLLSEPAYSLQRGFEGRDCRYSHKMLWLSLVVVGSVLLNFVLVVLLLIVKYETREHLKTPYVGLAFDTVDSINNIGPYGPSTKNETERAILWESLDGSSAQVAVHKSWAANKGLSPTQEFSWDKSKAVYSLRGFHGQHCLRKIYRWVAISYHNGTQLDHYEHVIHCLDSLLQDIRCFADDTLMRSPPRGSTSSMWGQGQQRQCRDWNKLKRWAEMQNACFSYFNETQGVKSMFDRYKWCPRDSPYGTKMRSVLGLPDEWNSQAPKDIDSLPAYWEIF